MNNKSLPYGGLFVSYFAALNAPGVTVSAGLIVNVLVI